MDCFITLAHTLHDPLCMIGVVSRASKRRPQDARSFQLSGTVKKSKIRRETTELRPFPCRHRRRGRPLKNRLPAAPRLVVPCSENNELAKIQSVGKPVKVRRQKTNRKSLTNSKREKDSAVTQSSTVRHSMKINF